MSQSKVKSAQERAAKPLLHYFDRTQPVDATRSRTMSKIRSKDTKPEMALRRALWARGLRFRVHDRTLPGTPDISNKSRKVAVFVDGCFWHGCPEHFRVPKTRTEFWEEKVRRNRAKRIEVRERYSRRWAVLEFFECQLKDPQDPVERIFNSWSSGRS